MGTGLVLKHGLTKDDVVAFMLHNCPEYIISLTGIIGVGGIATTINPSYTVTEIARQQKMANSKMIITSSNLVGVVKDVIQKIELEIAIIVLDARYRKRFFTRIFFEMSAIGKV